MVKVVNLHTDLADVVKLEGRGAHTTEAEAQASFRCLGPYRDGGLFVAHFSGGSGWEVHRKGDEIVQILEGATRLDIIVDDGIESHEVRAGDILVVPKGCWHRFESSEGVKVLTATPQPTEHRYVEDPRLEG